MINNKSNTYGDSEDVQHLPDVGHLKATMNETLLKVHNSEELKDYQKYYWSYQFKLGSEILLPHLIELNAFQKGSSVMEIGCGEGGVLAGFINAGAGYSVGTDIVALRLESGTQIGEIVGIKAELCKHDIIYEELKPEWEGAFDLAILRDVIEHLDDAEQALKNIKKILKPNGNLFVTFPPYHSPFGGHQHIVGTLPGKLPYIHLLPDFLFYFLIGGGRVRDIEEVRRLKRIRLTPDKFLHAARNAGFKVKYEMYYLLRPVFRIKFGLPPVKFGIFSKSRFLRNYFSLEAAYLLTNTNDNG
ncbi:MAG: Methyltransferase type 12 [Ignavibacteria bacterium]|nr:Methyltransferase type 12 [Ignavibacteria bacterium]